MKSARVWIVLLPSVVVLLALFQNCGADFAGEPLEESLGSVHDRLPVSATLHLSTRDLSSLEANRSGRILRWRDLSEQSIHFYPPLITNTNSLDVNRAPKLLDADSSGRRWLRFETATNNTATAQLGPAISDLRHFESDQATFSMVFRAPEFIGAVSQGIRVFDILVLPSTAAGHASYGYLTLDLIRRDETMVFFRAYLWYDGSAHLMLSSIDLPMADLQSGPQVLTVTFRPSKGGIRMAINGLVSDSAETSSASLVTLAGNPPALPSASRSVQVGSIYQAASRFDVGEVIFVKDALRNSDFTALHAHLMKEWGLGQGPSPVPTPTPAPTPAPTPGPSPSPATVTFAQVTAVFNKSLGGQTCIACHAAELASAASVRSANRNGRAFAIPGNSANSSLIRSVRKQAGVTAMPTNGASMSEADIQLLEQWINQGAN
jgi:cytochrome c5